MISVIIQTFDFTVLTKKKEIELGMTTMCEFTLVTICHCLSIGYGH